jgi:SAM-dependent methyltransferase
VSAPEYALGHTPAELERLGRQAKLVGPITRRIFLGAGLAPGMRVLDVGSGAGDTALLAADLVGPTGEVVGVDRSAVALETARARVEAAGHANVSFFEGDPSAMTFERPFDAVIGRYVLMFQPRPAELLRALAAHARPGAVIAFHEPSWDGVLTVPRAPLFEQVCAWIVESIRRTGAHEHMGMQLHQTFVAAGLAAPAMHLEAGLGGAVEAREWIALLTELVETLKPEIVRLGIATAEELDVPTLGARTLREVEANGSIVLGRYEIGAWTRR